MDGLLGSLSIFHPKQTLPTMVSPFLFSIIPARRVRRWAEAEFADDSRSQNWAELPQDVTASILSRLGAVDILTNAQMVCVAWHNICKDPAMWRSIDMSDAFDYKKYFGYDLNKMCRHAVDRSSRNVVDIIVDEFCTDELLNYITDSSRGIKRLQLDNCFHITNEGLSAVASKLPLLEELEISNSFLSHESLQVVGASCPLLKSFKFNDWWHSWEWRESNDSALAIAGTMHGLHHLQLRGNKLTNDGLHAILDRCSHLESLDLRECFHLKLGGELGRRCAERIKKLQLPDEPISRDESKYVVPSVSSDIDDGILDYEVCGGKLFYVFL